MSSESSLRTEPVTHWLEREGVAISWREIGQGPALVLLHAFPLHAAMWDSLVQHWKHRFRILSPVWRGFDGPSPLAICVDPARRNENVSLRLPVLGPEGTAPSLTHFADDVAAICSVSGIQSAIFAGCSMGGYVLLELLRRRAELVRAAIFCDTRPEADSEEGRSARLETNRWLQETFNQSGQAAAGAALAERMLPRLLGATTREHRPNVVQRVRDWIRQAPVDAVVFANAAMAARPDSRSLLPGLRIPALVIAGEEDVIIPPQDTAAFADRIPGADLRMIAGSGHLLPVEVPESFARELQTWTQAHSLFAG